MNFLTKTLLSQLAGFAAVAIDQMLQGGPTGGFSTWLTVHPQWVPLYVAGIGVVHNYLSAKFPVQAGSTQSPPPVPAPPHAGI